MKEYARVLIGCIVGLVVIIACIWLMLSMSRSKERGDTNRPAPASSPSER